MIQSIAIEKLHEHPDNPRKNVGDVTELAESIKQSGILQNLTVVPATGYNYGDYTVIIGHRRLAAAKQAGLLEVPCAVVEMSYKEQLATMLSENMQRTDLTIYEQAQGMQMMLDLGETMEDVSEKTGLSQSTVRRRVRLLKLDADKFKECEARQVSMAEYDKLFEIEDAELRNGLLECIGTSTFDSKLFQAKNAEKRNAERKAILEALCKFAEETGNTTGKRYCGYVWNVNDIEKLTATEGVEYFYKQDGCGITIYRSYTAEEQEQINKQKEADEQKQSFDEKRNRLAALRERFFNTRLDFIRDCIIDSEKIMNIAADTFISDWTNGTNVSVIEALTGEKITADDEYRSFPVSDRYKPMIEEDTERMLLYAAYAHTRDNKGNGYHSSYDCQHTKNESLDRIYGYLELLGYIMSDEEKAYREGHHELFGKETKQ